MGEAERGVSEAAALTGGPEGSIGAYLARERRLRSIGLDELAELTHLPRRALERLEAGAFDGERDAFARGYVRIVAEALGLDVDATLARMLPEPSWERAPRGRRLARALNGPLGAALIALSLIGGIGLWVTLRDTRAPVAATAPGTDLVYRRDAVRELADAPGSGAPADAPGAPVSAAPVAPAAGPAEGGAPSP